jgi:hypothetical protein
MRHATAARCAAVVTAAALAAVVPAAPAVAAPTHYVEMSDGARIAINVKVPEHAPPADDNDYAYVLKTPPGPNTLHFGGKTPSRLMLPIISSDRVVGFEAPVGQCPYASMRCLPGDG